MLIVLDGIIKKLFITPEEAAILENGGTLTMHGETITLANIDNYEINVFFKEKWVPGTGTHALIADNGSGNSAAGNYALAANYGNDAKGDYSAIFGQLGITTAAAQNAFIAGGQSNTAGAPCEHLEGMNNVANNVAEHAQGQYNKSHKASDTFGNAGNTTDSIGIGISLADAKNAEETMQNGDKYIIGIGGYDGTNPDEADTVQDVVAAKSSVSVIINVD